MPNTLNQVSWCFSRSQTPIQPSAFPPICDFLWIRSAHLRWYRSTSGPSFTPGPYFPSKPITSFHPYGGYGHPHTTPAGPSKRLCFLPPRHYLLFPRHRLPSRLLAYTGCDGPPRHHHHPHHPLLHHHLPHQLPWKWNQLAHHPHLEWLPHKASPICPQLPLLPLWRLPGLQPHLTPWKSKQAPSWHLHLMTLSRINQSMTTPNVCS